MALVSLLLNLPKEGILAKEGILEPFEGGFRATQHTLYEQPREIGSQCTNPNCIVHDPLDGKYARNKFHVLDGQVPRLRCHYCENDIDVFFVANRRKKTYEPAVQGHQLPKNPSDTIFFTSEKSAQDAHFVSRARRRAVRS
jgi:hypothetical protein